MLMPKKVKFRKHHRGRMRGRAKGGDRLSFGDFGLQVLEPMLWIFVVLTGLTVVQRTRRTLQQLPG